ncbi:hypothetical protein B0T26DRAFT_521618 [Lasiosphaeria miniovina]|uniref:Uncharacterized protein n=1 Tax=Lasiosphaeria miniovina TaxID=1954250 RepID=A0AA40DJV8_9PEZI|nr:uncharacterized protein B0T26DRAFT_521618 [Lasiosphaeria miniovina]KAK0704046.1 hypothetical protein B0T26DRAFT_521618 [Lasiosphaeria miniovina]
MLFNLALGQIPDVPPYDQDPTGKSENTDCGRTDADQGSRGQATRGLFTPLPKII